MFFRMRIMVISMSSITSSISFRIRIVTVSIGRSYFRWISRRSVRSGGTSILCIWQFQCSMVWGCSSWTKSCRQSTAASPNYRPTSTSRPSSTATSSSKRSSKQPTWPWSSSSWVSISTKSQTPSTSCWSALMTTYRQTGTWKSVSSSSSTCSSTCSRLSSRASSTWVRRSWPR